MGQRKVRQLCSEINRHLHDLDRVLNGLLDIMPYFKFEHNFNLLINEISAKNNLSEKNIKILSEYVEMCCWLDLAYEKWDMKNYENNSNYNTINSMYVEIHNSCNFKINDFLKIYSPEGFVDFSIDENKPISINSNIKKIEELHQPLAKRILNSINIKPGVGGISIDIKSLFKK